MAHYGFSQFGGGQGNSNGSIDPRAMSGIHDLNGGSNGYSTGSAMIADSDLLDMSPQEPNQSLGDHGQDFNGMSDINMGFSQNMYPSHINGYSNTPDGDPVHSPWASSFNAAQHFRQMQQPFGHSLQSPNSFAGSPLANDASNDGEGSFLNAKPRPRLSQAQSQAMQRNSSSNARSPLGANAVMAGLNGGSLESPNFGAQPIRTPGGHHEKSPSGQWMNTPKSLQSSYPGSGLSSPLQHGYSNPQFMAQAGTSMPARVNGAPTNLQSQEAKRKRRRESHNAVERRRRDNINERIQDLSRLVPTHRLEDDKVKKLIQNGTPLSPTLTGMSQPNQATSGLAGPGAKRAAAIGAGNITTGLPLEDKDKGPNKGDILNGSVSWMRDLMWMLQLKLQQQEELINTITEMGGSAPFELTDDEKRMQTELMEAMSKSEHEPAPFSYSRFNGSGLRVPHHTDYRGDSLNGAPGIDTLSISPGDTADLTGDLNNPDQFWNDPDDDVKDEDEYGGMDLTL